MTATLLQSIAVIFGAVSGILALLVYWRNSKLERMKWLDNLYRRFYEGLELKRVREILDCDSAGTNELREIVSSEPAEFTDYLNFFEFMAFLRKSRQLSDADIRALFGYYLDCLRRHPVVMAYINMPDKGYEFLRELLAQK